MTQQDISKEIDSAISKLADRVIRKTNIRADPNQSVVDIRVDGIPLEVSLPAIVNMLVEFMQYSVELYKEQNKKEKEDGNNGNGHGSGGCSEVSCK